MTEKCVQTPSVLYAFDGICYDTPLLLSVAASWLMYQDSRNTHQVQSWETIWHPCIIKQKGQPSIFQKLMCANVDYKGKHVKEVSYSSWHNDHQLNFQAMRNIYRASYFNTEWSTSFWWEMSLWNGGRLKKPATAVNIMLCCLGMLHSWGNSSTAAFC